MAGHTGPADASGRYAVCLSSGLRRKRLRAELPKQRIDLIYLAIPITRPLVATREMLNVGSNTRQQNGSIILYDAPMRRTSPTRPFRTRSTKLMRPGCRARIPQFQQESGFTGVRVPSP